MTAQAQLLRIGERHAGLPHSPQNFALGSNGLWQLWQRRSAARLAPHCWQNLPPPLGAEQMGQVTAERPASGF